MLLEVRLLLSRIGVVGLLLMGVYIWVQIVVNWRLNLAYILVKYSRLLILVIILLIHVRESH